MKFLLLLLALTSILPAQERDRTCRILFPNGPDLTTEKYYLYDGRTSQQVTLPRLSLSAVHKLRPGNIRIHLLSAPVTKPEEVPPGAPEVTVTADITDIYLLVSSDPDNKVLPLRMRVVNANYEKIGLGEMLWFNLTHKQVAGKIGRASLHLPANSSVVVKQPATSPGDYPVEIYFRVPGDERTHPLIESQWHHDPRSRFIVFVFDEGRRRAPKVMSFSDFRLAETKEDEG